MRFENFHCASPVCSPSRASFLTGRMPSFHGVHDWIRDGNIPPDNIKYLRGLTCYTDILANNGYKCGLSGKWHLGDSAKPQASFSHWYAHQLGGGPYYNAPMVRDGELVKEEGYVTDVITDDALAYLDSHKDETFYLSVHYTAPHSPWGPEHHPKDLLDSYDDCPFESCPQEAPHPCATRLSNGWLHDREMLKGYFAAVTAMDANVGRIMDKLDELGLSDDTLLVFTSDNGYSCGHHGFWGKGNGTYPMNMYENSVKVPFMARFPSRIEAGTLSKALVSAYDFMPTLLDFLDLPLPQEEALPGRSFLPVLEGGAEEARDEVVVFDEYGPVRMIRTHEWKYVHRQGDWPDELYDLVNDPDEREDLVDQPARKECVSEMRARLEEWFAQHIDPERDGWRQPVTGRGQLKMVSEPTDKTAFQQIDED